MISATDSDLPSGLYIIATPIGNIEDITLRALETLKQVDVIACEDTRITGKLTSHYGITAQKIPYHDHNAAEMRPRLAAMIKAGQRVALLSDAGMPLISDPGYKLVEMCAAEDIPVTCLPGPTASLTALVLSALPTDKFMFAGFLPPKSGARKTALSDIRDVPSTLIFYETAPRLIECLEDMTVTLGDRRAAVARELTKKFEEVRRGRLSELLAHYQEKGPPKGEIVIVVGAPEESQKSWSDKEIDNLIKQKIENGMSVKDASAFVASKSGAKKKDVYERALLLQGKKK